MAESASSTKPNPLRAFAKHVLITAKRLLYNAPFMRLAEGYLRRYYAFDLYRLWHSGLRPPPEWFDHRANLYLWSEQRIPYWVERGVYPRELMTQGCRVLDLCCGDGFYAYHFYSGTAAHIDAIDRDPTAIAHAQKWHGLANIHFAQRDAAKGEFPGKDYDIITWDAAIEHFSMDEIRQILGKCKAALKPGGILSGYTIIARSPDKSHPEHDHEFTSAQELKEVLRPFFPHVETFETEYPDRHNLYFRAAFQPSSLRRFS